MKSGNLRGKNSLTLTDVNFLDFSFFKEFTVMRSYFTLMSWLYWVANCE